LLWAAMALFVLAVLLFLVFPVAGLVALVLAAIGFAAWWRLRRSAVDQDRARAISEAGQTPEAVGRLPRSPDFELSQPGRVVATHRGGRDSATAIRFKAALRDSYALVTTSHALGRRPPPPRVDLSSLTTAM